MSSFCPKNNKLTKPSLKLLLLSIESSVVRNQNTLNYVTILLIVPQNEKKEISYSYLYYHVVTNNKPLWCFLDEMPLKTLEKSLVEGAWLEHGLAKMMPYLTQ